MIFIILFIRTEREIREEGEYLQASLRWTPEGHLECIRKLFLSPRIPNMSTFNQQCFHLDLQFRNKIFNNSPLHSNCFSRFSSWSPQAKNYAGKCDILFKFYLREPSEVRFVFGKRGKYHCNYVSCDHGCGDAAKNESEQSWRRIFQLPAFNSGLGLALAAATVIAVYFRRMVPRDINCSRISHFRSASNATEVLEFKPLQPQIGGSVPVVTGAGGTEIGRILSCVFLVYDRNDPREPAYSLLYDDGGLAATHNSTDASPVYFVGTRQKSVSKFGQKNKNVLDESVQLQATLNEGKGEIKGASGCDEDKSKSWLQELKEEALQKGVNKEVIERAFEGVILSERILEIDRNQPEVKLTAEAYLKRMVTNERVCQGVTAFRGHRALLEEISLKYGVPAPLLVAIWGVESSYGAYIGDWDTIQALFTMAYGSPESGRSKYFREEIFNALLIIEQGRGPPGNKRLQGSYAGAMGQCQFMPSSFLSYAIDYDGDGRTDIWESHADIFASMANYLLKHGWNEGHPIAEKVCLQKDIDPSVLGLGVKKRLCEWKNDYHVRPVEGELEVSPDEMASLIAPDGLQADAYLIYDNFRTIMRYNTSVLYSISVYDLARKILHGSLKEQ